MVHSTTDQSDDDPAVAPPVEDDWSHIMTSDLSGGSFATHDICDIALPNGTSLQIASTASLSPLDMMDLSWGSHDATGHRIWMGAELWIQALPALQTYFSTSTTRNDNSSTTICCRCLELGSGTGLAGIAAFKYFEDSTTTITTSSTTVAFDLVLTDNSESALKLCRINCQQNGLQESKTVGHPLRSLRVEMLEWGSTLESNDANHHVFFHVVFATDVIYDIAAWIPLLETARSSLLPNGRGHLLVAHVPRAALPDEVVVRASGSGGSTSEVSYHEALETYLIRTAREHGLFWKVSLKPKDLPPFDRQQDMEDAGASILVFQACSFNCTDTDSCLP